MLTGSVLDLDAHGFHLVVHFLKCFLLDGLQVLDPLQKITLLVLLDFGALNALFELALQVLSYMIQRSNHLVRFGLQTTRLRRRHLNLVSLHKCR